MKRSFAFALFCLAATAAFAQVSIDKPAATIKLIRQEVISVRQFKADIDKIETAAGRKLTVDQRKQLLDSKINGMLFSQYCEREKIIVSDAEVTQALSQMKASLGQGATDEKLEEAMRAQGVFLDAKTYARQQLLLQNYIKTRKADQLKSIKEPTSDEVLKEYDLHKSQLIRPDTVRASVLFVDFRGMSADQKKKSSDAIRSVALAVKGNSPLFDQYLLKASDSGSLYKGTANFYVEKTPQGQSVYGAAFIDKVFQMKAGEVSALIENEAGLQIVRVNEILPQKLLTLSDPLPNNPQATVQDYLKYSLLQQRQAQVLSAIQNELVAQLRKEGSIKIYDENLNF
jgi:peptidyl-prolyl cis-trans isomerase SurA